MKKSLLKILVRYFKFNNKTLKDLLILLFKESSINTFS